MSAARRQRARRKAFPGRDRRVVRAVRLVPVEAKLDRPILPPGCVLRGELIDRLREAPDIPVILLTAPAGYGKSTALAQWDQEDARPFVWLTVDERDNDPTILVAYLMLALQRLAPVDPRVLAAINGGDDASMQSVLPLLARMMARPAEPFVLVLDGAERLSNPAALGVLTTMADALPGGSQLALAARFAPDLPWSRFRASHRLLSVGPADLALTKAEATALLRAAGLTVSADDADRLHRRTEGWAAGLYLGALSMSAAPDESDARALAGDDTLIADYLRRELLAAQPHEQLSFLVRTSVLTRMSGPLCDAVLSVSGSAGTLRQLERANLFVVPLDRRGEWYRYHEMFAEMLRAELVRQEPGIVAQLHSNASRWFEEHGDVPAAMNHAYAAGEVDRAAHLLWSQVGICLASGRHLAVKSWLDEFSSDQVVGRPELALTAAWCAVSSGARADHWVAAAGRAADEARPAQRAELAAAVALARAALARDGLARMQADARLAARLHGAHHAWADPAWLSLARYYEAVALHLVGERDFGIELLEGTERLAARLGLPQARALCLAQLALLAAEDGDWERATTMVRDAETAATDHELLDAHTMAPVCAATALVLAKLGRPDEARAAALRTRLLLVPVDHHATWSVAQCCYVLGRAHTLLGDTAAARTALSEAQSLMAQLPEASALRDQLDEAWKQIQDYPLATGVGPSALSSAELRILQYLPTHLSFEMIGQRLYVSRNTVKTQAIAAYRKLGVTSRAEAVERGKALGIIEPHGPTVG